jgi:leucyl-tRNA synthetase
MVKQLKRLGASYDWSRKGITADPDYYKWTQWMFLNMYNNDLAYKKKQVANWCPSCNTVLANEQVVAGKCERCDTEVIQKELDQWLLKITKYSHELLEDLETLDWPDKTKLMQSNWIGRSQGAKVVFDVAKSEEKIEIFTTRVDTIFGATFMVLAPENPLVQKITSDSQKKEVEKYIEKTKKKTELDRLVGEKDKTGVFTGSYAVNPANGEQIPVWISDYVLMSYGTGAIMAVPAHDERDFEFAKKFDLAVREVVISEQKEEMFTGYGKLVNSGEFDGLESREAQGKIVNWLGKDVAESKVNYKLRDWLISRQRYWGAPIPIVNCEKCGEVPVPEKDLPVLLPEDVKMRSTGESPLKYDEEFINTTCPKCGGKATRETDTMDTFMCSSWYYFRYLDPKNEKEFAEKEKIEKWMPVDMYIGGAEHSVLHLLYSRFFTKVLRDTGYVSFDEPFSRLRHQGMILGPDGLKMSKSKGNVIDPDKEVDAYGADAVRMYLAFMGPYDQGGPWNPNGLTGVRRFLDKFADFVTRVEVEKQNVEMVPEEKKIELERIVNKLIKKVGEDIKEMKFNTCISAFMESFNAITSLEKDFPIEKFNQVWREQLGKVLLVIAPFAPYLSEELYQNLGFTESIHVQIWPSYDESLIKDDLVTVAVQINGKVRDQLVVPSGSSQEFVLDIAKDAEKVKKHLENVEIKKVIYVQDKLLSLVIN